MDERLTDVAALLDAFCAACQSGDYDRALSLFAALPRQEKGRETHLLAAVAAAFRLGKQAYSLRLLRAHGDKEFLRTAGLLVKAYEQMRQGLAGEAIASVRELLDQGRHLLAQAVFQELVEAGLSEPHLAELAALGARMLDTPLAPRNVLLDIAKVMIQLREFASAEDAFECAVRFDAPMAYWSHQLSIRFLREYRKILGAPLRRRPPAAGADRVTAFSLGYFGRFAHTLMDYIGLRAYADRHGLELQTPDWPGGLFFGLDEPLMEKRLAEPPEPICLGDLMAQGFPDAPGHPWREVDVFSAGGRLAGWFRERAQALLRPDPVFAGYLDPAVRRLRDAGRPVVACHIRRGDMLWEKHAVIYRPPGFDIYRRFLDDLRRELGPYVLYVATDAQPECQEALADHAPLFLTDVAEPWHGLRFLQDFHVLTQADVAVTSAGSFGTMACAFNTTASRFYRPDEERSRLEPFQPWE